MQLQLTVVVIVLLHLVSSAWYHALGNFIYNFFSRRYVLPKVHIQSKKWRRTAKNPCFFHFWAHFGTFSRVGSNNYWHFRIQRVRIIAGEIWTQIWVNRALDDTDLEFGILALDTLNRKFPSGRKRLHSLHPPEGGGSPPKHLLSIFLI